MKSILDEAKEIVDTSRQAEYNDPVENAVREALVMSATLGVPFTPKMMVLAMHTKKLVRSGRGHKHDNVVDKAGYAEIEARVEQAMKDGTVQKIVEKILGGWVKFDRRPTHPEIDHIYLTGDLYSIDMFKYGPYDAEIKFAFRWAGTFEQPQFGERLAVVRLKSK